MGCIFAELIHCSINYQNTSGFNQENRFIFPGSSCFPLSPCDEMQGSNDGSGDSNQVNIVSQNDQMIKILNVLGKQDESLDMSFIYDEGVQKY